MTSVDFSERSKQYGDDVVGPLHVKIVGATLTRDTEVVGKMDPYLELTIGGVQVHKTATLDGAGKTPEWNEECDYEVRDLSAEVTFKVSDEDWGADDVVGAGTCTLADLCVEPGTDVSLPIKYEGGDSGTVRFVTTWVNFHTAKNSEEERLRQEEEAARLAAEAAAKAEEERLE